MSYYKEPIITIFERLQSSMENEIDAMVIHYKNLRTSGSMVNPLTPSVQKKVTHD